MHLRWIQCYFKNFTTWYSIRMLTVPVLDSPKSWHKKFAVFSGWNACIWRAENNCQNVFGPNELSPLFLSTVKICFWLVLNKQTLLFGNLTIVSKSSKALHVSTEWVVLQDKIVINTNVTFPQWLKEFEILGWIIYIIHIRVQLINVLFFLSTYRWHRPAFVMVQGLLRKLAWYVDNTNVTIFV